MKKAYRRIFVKVDEGKDGRQNYLLVAVWRFGESMAISDGNNNLPWEYLSSCVNRSLPPSLTDIPEWTCQRIRTRPLNLVAGII